MERILPIDAGALVDTPKDGKLLTWNPILGLEFNRYLGAFLPEKEEQATRLSTETPRILSACVKPLSERVESRSNAGLVIGYVQSGKTSSFTAVTALAKDNNFNCIIIIGGTSKILLDQTIDRLKKDLNLNHSDVVNRWLFSENPKLNANRPDVAQIQNLLTTQSMQVLQHQKQIGATPLIAVMKESSHLKNLNNLLAGLTGPEKMGLNGITALIIDDECHMSSPNIAKNIDEHSKIYSLMRELRSYIPNHTLLQYTATPQANLLCKINDEFRPEFVRMLGTGSGYTGGRHFFIDTPKAQNIRRVPRLEQQAALAASSNDLPPETLKSALAAYLMISSDDLHKKLTIHQNNFEQFSMLVHSNASLSTQKVFSDWISSLKTSWMGVLARPDNDPDRTALINSVFRPAFDDLQQTASPKLESLEALLGSPVSHVLNNLIIWSVNGNKKGGGVRDPNFKLSNYNIINGGDMLGVGFTIPKLTITHMLRAQGQGQLDTVQQRGRFFGYCAQWFDRIRVWLGEEVQDLFAAYVEHEEQLRDSLYTYDINNLQLKNWKVKFRLDKNAQACRRGAIKLQMKRFASEGGWVDQDFWSDNQENKTANISRVNDFMDCVNYFSDISPKPNFSLADQSLIGGTPDTSHQVASYKIGDVIRLLSDYKVDTRNGDEFDVLFETLTQFKEVAEFEMVDVVHMAAGRLPGLRRRNIKSDGSLDLYQGPNKPNYVGDRSVHTQRITVQIRFMDHGPSDDQIIERNVVYLTVWLPEKVKQWAEGWMLQDE
jgi:hypothetical protein